MIGIRASIRGYERWMRERLGDAFVPGDLKEKHKLMRKELFSFLRGTCWRWAETARDICPDLAAAPAIASVGDAHVGNFGLWRDGEGRLAWGVNDYDEAALTPWPFDLVRLGTSALLADKTGKKGASEIAAALLDGYRDGLKRPGAVVLEREHLWLRGLFATSDEDREDFWKELLAAKKAKKPPGRFVASLEAALPEPGLKIRVAPRQAGVGSLGRMRLVASSADYRGAPMAREAKALIPSCWDRTGAPGAHYGLAFGRYRCPDPWLQVEGAVAVRRLAPNSRKLDLKKLSGRDSLRLLGAMAFDLAGIHASDAERLAAARADLKQRKKNWLEHAMRDVADATGRDWRSYRGG